MERLKRNITGKNGIRLSLYTGYLEHGFADRWSTLHFFHAYEGDFIQIKDKAYEFAVATYSLEWEDQYMYTYCYEREENWATYTHDLTPDSYRQEEYTFQKECYFRINCRRVDGEMLTAEDEEKIADALEFYSTGVIDRERSIKECFVEELQNTVQKLENLEGKKYILLTDTHYVVNGTWEDTLNNIRETAAQTKLDGIIHLGDITDGMVSREVNIDYVNRVLNGLKSLHLPLYLTLGNHDSNYFHNNPEKFSEEEQYEYYLKDIHQDEARLYYYKDIKDSKVRFFFLHSFDYREQVRYGFSDHEAAWFEETIKQTPEDYRIIIFSHVPPLTEIHFWSNQIRNGEKMVDIAETYMKESGQKILAWIHGHNHADAVYRARQFPIVAIGCNKYEYFLDKKPEGSYTPERKVNDASQDLWDVLCIQNDSDILKFVRFGAGEDREV